LLRESSVEVGSVNGFDVSVVVVAFFEEELLVASHVLGEPSFGLRHSFQTWHFSDVMYNKNTKKR